MKNVPGSQQVNLSRQQPSGSLTAGAFSSSGAAPECRRSGSFSGTFAAALFLLLHLALFTLAAFSSRPDINFRDRNPAQRQYEDWAVALEEGHQWLSEPVPESLLSMENPYDYVARVIRGNESGDYYPGDVALYDGHYFVYFGCAPEYLFFLPVRLITGHMLPTWIAVWFCGLLAVPGAMLLARNLARRYGAGTIGAPSAAAKPESSRAGGAPMISPRATLGAPLCSVLFIAALFLAGSGLPYLVSLGGTYSMPLVLGLAATFWGLVGWLAAADKMAAAERMNRSPASESDADAYDRAAPKGGHGMSAGTAAILFLSSLLLALNIGCRPQCALVCLLAFPIFEEEIRAGRFFRLTREAVVNTLCVVLPFAIVGVFVLGLNAARFGSPFEFGFHYLLTTADMLHHRASLRQAAVGAWMELLKPLNLDLRFPFLHGVEWNEALTEGIYIEPMLGGFFALAPFALVGFAAPFIRKEKHGGNLSGRPAAASSSGVPDFAIGTAPGASGAKAPALVSLAVGIVIVLADVVSAGVSQRYESDFALFFLIPAVIVFLRSRARRPLRAALIALILFSVAVGWLTVLSDGRYFSMKDYNPAAFEAMRQFWP